MKLTAFVVALDAFHRAESEAQLRKRMLYGHVFGKDLPAYVIFHAMLGYILLGIGAGALILRLPFKIIRRRRWLHLFFGYVWIFGTIWMPVTAIWCVYSFTGWDVIAFFIFSMFATIQFGYLLIKIYQQRQTANTAAELNSSPPRKSRQIIIFKVLHAICMTYSFIMLLGAGISFPFRSFSQYPSP